MFSAQEHIYIIGSGAIGKALAVFLKLAKRKVRIIRGRVNDGTRKKCRLRVEMADDVIQEADIDIITLDTLGNINGIVVIATKSFGNEQLAVQLKKRNVDSPLVLLQNGLGVEQPFIRNGFSEIYRCILFVTSQTVDLATVKFRPVKICPIGIERGNIDRLNRIVQQLSTPGFMFKSEMNIHQIIWKKTIINCVFNSICPLLEVDNGIFYRSEQAHQIASRIIAECVVIAKAEGIKISARDVEKTLLQISKSSDGQLISTLQDIRNNRMTEVDTLNPKIVEIAELVQLGKVVRETRLLGELIRIKSNLQIKDF